jgi:uncharacterized membrane protein HdeD (DUF308 family)
VKDVRKRLKREREMQDILKTAEEYDEKALRHWSVSVGVALLILGVVGCVALILIDRLTTFEISIAMLGAGVLQISHAIGVHRKGWSVFTIIGALLYLVAASAILVEPLIDDQMIEYILVASLASSGISRLITAGSIGGMSGKWEGLSGMTTFAAAAIIFGGLSSMTLWPLAFVIALDIIVEGATMASAGFAVEKTRPEPDEF